MSKETYEKGSYFFLCGSAEISSLRFSTQNKGDEIRAIDVLRVGDANHKDNSHEEDNRELRMCNQYPYSCFLHKNKQIRLHENNDYKLYNDHVPYTVSSIDILDW